MYLDKKRITKIHEQKILVGINEFFNIINKKYKKHQNEN